MSRLDTMSRGSVKPGINVYTALAAIGFLITACATGYAVWLYLKIS